MPNSHPTHAQPPKPTPTPTPKPAPPRPPNQPPEHKDPQEAKLEAHAAPPRWDAEIKPLPERPPFTPQPALDPRAVNPPAGAYVDGMGIADEQRARSAYIEQHGVAAYMEEIDQRPPEERQNKQVPGVTPPTKRPAPSEDHRR